MGECLRDLAPEVGCHEKTMARYLRKYGACIRGYGPSPNNDAQERKQKREAAAKVLTSTPKPKRRVINIKTGDEW